MEIILIILVVLVIVFQIILLLKSSKGSSGTDADIKNSLSFTNEYITRVESSVKDEISRNREEFNKLSKDNRTELNNSFSEFNITIKEKFDELTGKQKELSDVTEKRLEKMRETVESKLKSIQEDNTTQLEKMRATVDEKLQSTLEKRLGDSFKIVSERLEKVHQGLGEMQNLASGVGDLKKVLSNVKTRGVFGEYQLENILEQLLTPEQYAKNVKTKAGSNDSVEFAIKMPGKDDTNGVLWLPIDAKFPTEVYQALSAAYDSGDTVILEAAKKELTNNIKRNAKYIADKYIDPPNTTDFGIMFLPFESLYAEVLRIPGLFEQVQREYKITITGPTTISALLNSLQMGFKTLAIGKRSSEVWQLLGAVKTEFSNYGTLVEKSRKKISEAATVLDNIGTRSRAIERKLRDVQELPSSDAVNLLGNGLDFDAEDNN
ncbi:MAG: DNA recombination protein RmuC [Ignavibacteria bacterium]|nr:DNA recombination protein RmuC [Ignavibacteria bacterium]